MKREIDCMKCGNAWKDPAGRHQEFMAKRIGYALFDYMCDGCGEELPKGQPVMCVSVWSERGGIPYFPWESESITPMTGAELDAYERLNGTKLTNFKET